MRNPVVAGSVLTVLSLLAGPAQAQRVEANVIVRGGPVAGRVVIGDAYRPYHRRVVVYRRAPVERIIVVERVHRHRGAGYWRHHGYRPITLYYIDGRYFDRDVGYRPGMREVVVYHRDGRYYRDCDRRDRDDYGDDRDWDD